MFEHEGPNLLDQREPKPFDCHCPLMGGSKKNNYWQVLCNQRQINKDHNETCYPYCKAKDKLENNNKSKNTRDSFLIIVEGLKNKKTLKELSEYLGISVASVHKHKVKAIEKGLL